jgi:hypothetical protein
MSSTPEDALMNAWKQQFDTGLRVIQTILEGAARIRAAQLKAATEAQAAILEAQKVVQGARDTAELMRLQADWMGANVGRAMAYWRSIFQSAMQTNAELMSCLWSQPPAPLPQAFAGSELDASKRALLGMMDQAYQQWLDASRQFYKGSSPSSTELRP